MCILKSSKKIFFSLRSTRYSWIIDEKKCRCWCYKIFQQGGYCITSAPSINTMIKPPSSEVFDWFMWSFRILWNERNIIINKNKLMNSEKCVLFIVSLIYILHCSSFSIVPQIYFLLNSCFFYLLMHFHFNWIIFHSLQYDL